MSEEPGRLTRPFATPAMARANELVGGWMADAGLEVRVDEAGNLVGRLAGTDPEAGTLLLGSHLDSVRDAGAFDGPLGVLAAVACVERLRAEGTRLPFAVDVLGFSDEEGLRYGTAYLGSRAVAGSFDPALLELVDDDGVALGDALRAFGGAPQDVARASRQGERLLGYCEVHIEQGPVLEGRDAPVGVVTAIAGATRAELELAGRAGHAGTVPMDARHDARLRGGGVGPRGRGAARARARPGGHRRPPAGAPGAPNVVPGAAVASLDVRHADDAVREAAVAALRAAAQRIGAARGVEVAWREVMSAPAVAMRHRARRAAGRSGRGTWAAGRPPGQRRRPRRGGAVRADRRGDALRALRRRRQPPPRRVGRRGRRGGRARRAARLRRRLAR